MDLKFFRERGSKLALELMENRVTHDDELCSLGKGHFLRFFK